MIAIVGDAEMDEGNVYEALLEGWKHDLRNCWWIIDYNRQSLDGVVSDRLFRWIDRTFRGTGWTVVTLKYGKRMMAAFQRPGGKALKRWINDCPNDLYAALTFQGGKHWRRRLMDDIGAEEGVAELLGSYDDDGLQDLMTNLGGHCLETILEAFASITDDTPACFIAYTIKGHGLPLAGHKDNHSGIMNGEQMDHFRRQMGIEEGDEWEPFSGLGLPPAELQAFLGRAPFKALNGSRRKSAAAVPVPKSLPCPDAATTSTQEAFGRILFDIAGLGGALADRIVTTSPDVTQSTGLGGWVNRRGIFARDHVPDTFRDQKVASAQKWEADDGGQHVELGIAENNLFLLLGAFGLAHELFGERLLPIGTLYDPFIQRGLDALNYACYQDARFMLVATPSGLSLAPEGGAHQSIVTPLIGIGQPGLASFEPAFADELSEIMRWGFEYMQDPAGGSVALSDSTLANPTFDADVEGSYTATLVVNDGALYSAVDTVTITAIAPPDSPTTISIGLVDWWTEGGKNQDKHLYMQLTLWDDLVDSGLVSGATVSVELKNLDSGWAGTAAATTGDAGTVTFALKNAPSGTYVLTVTGVSHTTLTWDGISPDNPHTK